MSSISSLLSDGYFSLKNESASTDTTKTATPSMASALASLNTTSGTASSADSVNLSPEAQAYLDSLNGTSSSTSGSSSGDHFTLTKAQQETLDAILANYKDEPFTDAVFGKIQQDLDNAGISPDVLNAQDKMRGFNPTQFMLDALNGTDSGTLGTFNNDNNGAVKANNYLKSVAEQWSNISTTISKTEA